ncbi:MAG TPA: SIMPL domain-containing protein [Pilimelia sp.]|nr:SIMPL domain-containing protein [Pilimelia sp.]
MVDTPTIAVRGEAALEMPPELARFTVTVAARDKDRAAALSRLTGRTAAIRAVLDGYAAAVERRETGAVQVRPELRRSGERVAAYAASLTTVVTVTDFTVLGELLLRLADEDQTSVYGPSWELRRDSPVHREARRAAVADAVVRAREYAEAVGATLVRLITLTDAGMSGGQPVHLAYSGMALRDKAGGGPDFDLEPQQQTVHASVEMRFAITEALPAEMSRAPGAGDS